MNKKELLQKQIAKLSEVINVLTADFPEEELGEEVGFLSIAKSNLEELSTRELIGC